MNLLNPRIEAELLLNGISAARSGMGDFTPVAKLFFPASAATWLITEMLPEDPDILFGLCDLGMGFPELGSVRRSELQDFVGPAGLRIERDLYFVGRYPISVYAEAARRNGCITEDDDLLAQAARLLSSER